MAEFPSPFRAVAGGVLLAVRLAPKARAARVGPVVAGSDGRGALKVAVTEAPEKGKANRALIRLLAKTLRLPQGALTVVRGLGERNKTVMIAGDAADVARRLAAAKP